uniref:RhlB protein n=2 Tax=Endopterygota TaxID=33392 RepID=A0A0C9R5T3_9HYME
MQKLVAVLFVGLLCILTYTNGQLLLYPNRGTILTLTDVDLASQDNKVEIVQDYIVEVLKLPELRWRVRQARGDSDRTIILFEMESADDVEKIMKQDVSAQKIVREEFFMPVLN